jgi:transcriptional repressor NrdR
VHCPFCRNTDSRVIDSRTADDGTAIRRRRSCAGCGRRFTTQETVILMVAKRSGATEPFTRDKIIRGVRRACQGRPVDEDHLAILAQQVEETIRARGCAEISSHEVGLAILGPLRELDEVAYLRFASVYRGFESAADFEKEIALLRATTGDPSGLGSSVPGSSVPGSGADSSSVGSSEAGSSAPGSPEPALADEAGGATGSEPAATRSAPQAAQRAAKPPSGAPPAREAVRAR